MRLVFTDVDGREKLVAPCAPRLDGEDDAAYLTRLAPDVVPAGRPWRLVGDLAGDAAWIASEAVETAAQDTKRRSDAKDVLTSVAPQSRATRAMGRLIMQRIQAAIDQGNVIASYLNARGASIPLVTKSNWPQLLAAVRRQIDNEADPTQ